MYEFINKLMETNGYVAGALRWTHHRDDGTSEMDIKIANLAAGASARPKRVR
jgi:hypothetical protein